MITLPTTYAEWRHCITVTCKSALRKFEILIGVESTTMALITRTLSLALIALLLAACGNAPVAQPPATPSEAPAVVVPTDSSTAAVADPTPEPTRILALAAPRDLAPGEQDPYYAIETLKVWESLVTVDENWMPAPQLAEAWTMAEDGLSWTFSLRRDVVFSDGTPFTADVVLANVERMRKISPRPSPFYSFDSALAYGDLKDVIKVDDFTVQFIHNTPEPTFPAMLATYFSAMFAPSSFTESGDFAGYPIASGPFQVVERVADQYVVLEPNPRYRGTPARVARVEIKTIPDPNTRAAALRAGEIQGVLDLGAIQPVTAKELTASGLFSESTALNSITHLVFVNGTQAPWNDPRLRQAISQVIDRSFVVDSIFLGYGEPAGSMLNAVARTWHDPALTLPYDPKGAAALAAEVLGDARQPARIIVPSWALNMYPYKTLAEYLQAQLAPLGIDAEITILDGGAFLEAAGKGEYELALRIQGLWSSDPASLFDNYLGCDRGQNKTMSLAVCDPAVEDSLARLSTEADLETRKQDILALQAFAASELPVIPIMYEQGLIVFSNDLTGYTLTPQGLVTLETAAFR